MSWFAIIVTVAAVQGRPVQPLRFDFRVARQTRDSFAHFRNGIELGYLLRVYEMVHSDASTEFVLEDFSEARGGVAYMRIAADPSTGAPVAFYSRVTGRAAIPTPHDTVMAAINVSVRSGNVTGDRCLWTANGSKHCVPVRTALPPQAVWSPNFFWVAGLIAAPGDSLTGPVYAVLRDSVVTVSVVAEPPESLVVAAGRFEVLPLRSGAWRISVTRSAPRRIVRLETLDAAERFDLASRAGETFLLAAAVDERPILLHTPALAYPESARQAGVQGRVLAECVIDTSGHVEPGSVRIIDTPDPRFEQPAKAFLRGAAFRPGRVRGQTVRVLMRIPVDFTLSPR